MDNVISTDMILMISKLKKITAYWQEIIKILNDDTILCGGLVLQTLISEEWDTDIDIFTTNVNLKELCFGTWKQLPKKNDYIIIPGVIRVYNGIVIEGEREISIDIVHVTNFKDLFRGFDFPFCKLHFNGKKIHVDDPDSVISKSCIIHKDDGVQRNFDVRVPKYRNRGFTITIL